MESEINKSLKQIVEDFREDWERSNSLVEKLRSRLSFCQEHKFLEEERITRVKLDSFEMITYRNGNILKRLEKIIK